MIAADTGIAELLQLLPTEQPHGGAQPYAATAVDFADISAGAVEIGAAEGAARSHHRESAHTAAAVVFGGIEAFLTRHQRIHVAVGVVMRRLGAPFAVFGATSRACVDYGAEIEFTRTEPLRYFCGPIHKGFASFFRINVGQSVECLLGEFFSCKHALQSICYK